MLLMDFAQAKIVAAHYEAFDMEATIRQVTDVPFSNNFVVIVKVVTDGETTEYTV